MEEVCSIGEVWSRCLYVCFFSGRIVAKRQTVGIIFTQRPKISIFADFAPQGRLVAPIYVKFGMAEGHVGLLGRVNFHANRCTGVGLVRRPQRSLSGQSVILLNTENLTRTTKKQNTYKRKLGAQKMALINCRKRTRKICAKETGQTETGLVAFYDIRHGAGLFLQPRSPHRGNCTTIDDCRPV